MSASNQSLREAIFRIVSHPMSASHQLPNQAPFRIVSHRYSVNVYRQSLLNQSLSPICFTIKPYFSNAFLS